MELVWTNLSASLSDGRVWLSFAIALLLGAACVLVGTWITRRVGLLAVDASLGETLGVGLGSGLLVLAAAWAAVLSGGRSSFTPVAVAFAVSIILARRWRGHEADPSKPAHQSAPTRLKEPAFRRSLILRALGGSAFVILVGLLYGGTMAPSPRAGVQPVEMMDVAYYSVLGADLARTGVESIYSPAGFGEIGGLPIQTWYHWGEIWISAFVITVSGLDPLLARHYVVLPIALLAAAALTGTIVRKLTGTSSRGAFLFGAVCALFLAPVPLPGQYFSIWATGLIFGIGHYGLATICALLALYILAVHSNRKQTWTLSIFCAGVIASLLPAHIVVAALASIGVGGVVILRLARSLQHRRRLPTLSPRWRVTSVATGCLVAATIVWGVVTDHALGATGLSGSVTPFNASWRASVALVILGSGAFAAIPAMWLIDRRTARPGRDLRASLYGGTLMILTAGAIAWGARLGDFNMFHVFFGGIVVFGTPIAAVAVWVLWNTAKQHDHLRAAAAIVLFCGFQLEIGVALGILRLHQFGPHEYEPMPVSILEMIEALPSSAKLAYSCHPREEVAFWDPKLASITAHTGRRIVPMCFQAEGFGSMTGVEMSPEIESPLFGWAPQRRLYPDLDALPSSAQIAAFLQEHGIRYIYADAIHPNILISDAILIATEGDVEILRVPPATDSG